MDDKGNNNPDDNSGTDHLMNEDEVQAEIEKLEKSMPAGEELDNVSTEVTATTQVDEDEHKIEVKKTEPEPTPEPAPEPEAEAVTPIETVEPAPVEEAEAEQPQITEAEADEASTETETSSQEPDMPEVENDDTSKTEDTPVEPKITTPSMVKKSSNGKILGMPKKVFIIVVAIIILAGGAAAYLLVLAPSDETATEESSQVIDEEQAEEEETAVDTTQYNWLGEPEKVAYIDIFDDDSMKKFFTDNIGPDPIDKNNIDFFKLGSSGDTEIYVGTIVTTGLGDYYRHFYLTKTGDEYKLLTKLSDDVLDESGSYIGIELNGKATLDYETTISDLEVSEMIDVDGGNLESKTGYFISGRNGISSLTLKDYTELAKVDEGTMYERIDAGSDNGVKRYSLLLKSKAGLLAEYQFVINQLNDDYSLPITWNDGTSTSAQYRWDTVERGCGFGHSVNVLDKNYHGDLVESGTVNGATVYTLPNANHKVIETFYDNYKVGREAADTVSKQEFFDSRPVVAIKNELNYYVLLADSKYQPNVECAKPVIYLYPETPTLLNVQVGADVTKSEPHYTNIGWNVVAMPDGTLLVNGEKYGSLFWDGTGHGQYPSITKGFVVPQAEVDQTIENHLIQMGLNETERNDFLEYWLPLIPDDNFVRLTWLNTDELNRLAPLKLSATPETLYRIFLDFEGLNSPIDIPEQTLIPVDRQGFTVIEWGGLKVGN